MSEWKTCTLGDVVTLQRGFDLPKKDREKGKYPLMVSNGQDGTHKEYKVDAPGVVTGRSGTLGQVFYVKEKFWPLNTTLWVKDFHNNNEKFIYYFLKTLGLEKYNAGSGVPTLNRNHIHPLPVVIPEITEQKAIGEVLSSLDDKIDLLHRQNKTLENLAETLFRHYFIDNAKDDWDERPLSFFGDIVCGKTPSKKKTEYFNGNVPFIKIPDMHGKIYIINTSDTLTKTGKESQENKTIPPFSICVSCIATVGLVSMNTVESQTNQQINTVIPYKEIYRYYLLLYMKNSFEILQAMGSGGTATLNINTSSFSKMYIEKPDDIILEKFLSEVKPFFDKILSNTKQIQTLEKLRDTLLPKLISGEVKINNNFEKLEKI